MPWLPSAILSSPGMPAVATGNEGSAYASVMAQQCFCYLPPDKLLTTALSKLPNLLTLKLSARVPSAEDIAPNHALRHFRISQTLEQ
jgi:hypothetical protein